MIGGFWIIDANTKASIYLKNGLETSAITVNPAIFLSNGMRYDLAPVSLEPSATSVISINDALANQGVAPWGILSGYVEVNYSWAWDPLCVTVTSVDALHSVIFTSGFQPPVASDLPIHKTKLIQGLNTVEGVWWKPDANVTGFIALSNASNQPANAKVKVSNDENVQIGQQSVQVSPHGTKIVQLDVLKSLSAGATGGLQIQYTGTASTMLINGALEDLNSGFSANLPFHFFASPDPTKQSHETYAELGLMTGPADPMMSFPAGTTFTPFSVLRNVEALPVTVTPSLYWMEGAVARSAQLPSFALASFSSLALDVPSLLASAGLGSFYGNVNLILDADGPPRSLLLASGSVDAKKTYVFQVFPRGIQESAAKSISYWSTGNGDDTMVTVWNPADEAQDFRFTLNFTGGHYRLPLHLEPRATQTFNISEIIQNQIPDAEGNTVPLGVHEGSAKISGMQADNEQILVALDAGTYNVRKATCSYYCISCDGSTDAYVDAGSVIPFVVGAQSQFNIHEDWNNGNSYYTNTGSWNSSLTSIATVGSSNGMGTGISPGTTTLSDYTTGDVYDSNYCGIDPFCPYVAGFTGSVLQPVSVTVTFGYTPVVPLNGSATISATVTGNTQNATIYLYIGPEYGTTGEAVFSGSGNTYTTITSTTTLSISGVQASSAPNNMVLFAVLGSTTLATTNFTVAATNGAIPVNFRQIDVYDAGNGDLHFDYKWDSSSGNLADLEYCIVGEYVTNQDPRDPWPWPSPPFPPNTSGNPTTVNIIATQGGSPDDHRLYPYSTFAKPYSFSTFTATQYYRFACTYYDSENYHNMQGPNSIVRTVSQNPNSSWKFTVTKSGAGASINPLP